MKRIILAFTLSLSISVVDATPAHQWHKTQLPTANSLRGSAVFNDTLWVTGSNNGVFRSTDQGRSWQNISVKADVVTDFRDIHVFDENTAIIMGAGTGNLSKLYKTNNAGQTWQLLYDNPDAQGFFDAIDFWNDRQGLLLGDPVDGYFVIYKTQDGGKTFKRIGKDKIPQLRKGESAFAASGHSLIVGNNGKAWFTTGGLAAHVYESLDYGESWQRQAVPLHDKNDTSGGYSLALNAKEQVFVLGGDYKQRAGEYINIATKVVDTWIVPGGEVQRGLRTAMQCAKHLCLNTGKLFTGISQDGGANWKLLTYEGYYTMAKQLGKSDKGKGRALFLMAGHQGTIAVVTFKSW